MTAGGARQIAKAALVVMVAFVLSRVLGLARATIIGSLECERPDPGIQDRAFHIVRRSLSTT